MAFAPVDNEVKLVQVEHRETVIDGKLGGGAGMALAFVGRGDDDLELGGGGESG